jgi:hypothetical protein
VSTALHRPNPVALRTSVENRHATSTFFRESPAQPGFTSREPKTLQFRRAGSLSFRFVSFFQGEIIMNNRIKTNRIPRDAKLMAGFRKHGKGLTFNVAGKRYTVPDILRLLQGRIDAGDTVSAAKAAFHAAVAADRAEVESTEPLLAAIRQTLLITLSASPEVLADFGLAPKKPRRALTVKEKSVAVEQAQATRVARHTMGSRQKRLVTGDATPREPAPAAPPLAASTPPPPSATVVNGANGAASGPTQG